tara:strand:- start:1592 stop:2305 length:714 start_codon:yes stop_codon:yes gene_type:complete
MAKVTDILQSTLQGGLAAAQAGPAATIAGAGLGLAGGLVGAAETEDEKRRREEMEALLAQKGAGTLGLTDEERQMLYRQKQNQLSRSQDAMQNAREQYGATGGYGAGGRAQEDAFAAEEAFAGVQQEILSDVDTIDMQEEARDEARIDALQKETIASDKETQEVLGTALKEGGELYAEYSGSKRASDGLKASNKQILDVATSLGMSSQEAEAMVKEIALAGNDGFTQLFATYFGGSK